eukprot:3084754-Amphidinium_carterae.1
MALNSPHFICTLLRALLRKSSFAIKSFKASPLLEFGLSELDYLSHCTDQISLLDASVFSGPLQLCSEEFLAASNAFSSVFAWLVLLHVCQNSPTPSIDPSSFAVALEQREPDIGHSSRQVPSRGWAAFSSGGPSS